MMETLAKVTKVKVITKIGEKTQYTVEMPHQVLADEFVNIFAGIPSISLDALSDENGKRICDVEVLKKKGCVFARISVMRNLANESYCTKTIDRKYPNPLLESGVVRMEVYDVEVLLNIVYANKVQKLIEEHNGNTAYEVKEERSSGILNYRDSRVVCEKDGVFYLSYVVYSYLNNRRVFNEDGRELTTEELIELNTQLKSSYRKEIKEKGAERQAEKMGIPVEALPKIRTMKMENIGRIKVFNRDYIPVEEF